METRRTCPVCHASPENAKTFVERNIDPSRLSGLSFASRKEPEFMSHRLVQCPQCDLVYADCPPQENELAHAYHTAEYDSAEEANDAAAAYVEAMRPILDSPGQRRSVLEIGAGNGAFLECLSHEGFTQLVGIEPSRAAIASAPGHCRAWLREGMFDRKDFPPESFDLVCCFMTMEHVREPEVVARAALELLRPGGVFAVVTHDYRSPVNRLLGRRSPIIDIEHMQLFSRGSIRQLFANAGYVNITSAAFANSYPLRYWLRLMPLPRSIKSALSSLLQSVGADRTRLKFNVGNLLTTGYKRA